MEHILNNCILALLDYPGSTLLGINRILVDKAFRRRVIAKIKDPIVKAFWMEEYANWEQRFRVEAIQPIQNKVGQFLSSSMIRNIVAQVKSTLDMRDIMDRGKIIIMNLSKGRLGEDTSRLLGGMLITKLQLAAMERVDVLEEERRDFYLYVDEFQNFATEAFANILSEARKYRLNLIVAHQYVGQLLTETSTRVRDAVFGNVGTMVIFRIGAEDAEFVAKEFAPHFTEEDLLNLTKYDIYLKLMIDGVASNPFSATTLPPVSQFQGQRDKIIKVTRERYAERADKVEEKVLRWSGFEEGDEDGAGGGGRDSAIQGSSFGPTAARVGPADARSAARIQRRDASQGMGREEQRDSSAGFRLTPQRGREETVRIDETMPVVKVTPEIKPISLSEAMQKKPTLIKLGPRPNSPPRPPEQRDQQRMPQRPHQQQQRQPQPTPRPPQQLQQPRRDQQRPQQPRPPQPRQNLPPQRGNLGGQAQPLKPGEVVRIDQKP